MVPVAPLPRVHLQGLSGEGSQEIGGIPGTVKCACTLRCYGGAKNTILHAISSKQHKTADQSM